MKVFKRISSKIENIKLVLIVMENLKKTIDFINKILWKKNYTILQKKYI